MVDPPRKFTPEEIAANNQATVERDIVERELKQEGISRIEASRNRGSKRKNNNTDDDEISIISVSERPKELQGHNAFDTAPYWTTPTQRRRRQKPLIYISNMNNVGSPTSSIESPLAATQRKTHTSNDGDSESDEDVVEKPLIGSRVAVKRASAILFGTILSCATVEGRTYYSIEYDDRSIEQVSTLELSILQELYITEMNNDVVGQQKKKSQSTQEDEFVGTRVSFSCGGIAFYGTVKSCFMNDRRKKTWYVLYDNGKDEEEILRPEMLVRQKHYVRHGKYDPTLPDVPPPQLPSSSTTKKDSNRRTTTHPQLLRRRRQHKQLSLIHI